MLHAEAQAEKVAADLGLDHPTEVPIEAIGYLLGAVVKKGRMAGAAGRLMCTPSRAIITISDEIKFEQRYRWTVAHELGHLRLHRKQSSLEVLSDTSQTSAPECDQAVEKEANAFAGELLMPRRLLNQQVDVKKPTLSLVQNLAKEYQVSLSAAAIRFVKVCPERCALVFSQNSRVKWSAKGPEFGHWIQHDVKLDPYSLAHDYFTKGSVQQQQLVSASTWLSGERYRYDEHEILEDCIPVPSLNATLSLLWIPSNSEL